MRKGYIGNQGGCSSRSTFKALQNRRSSKNELMVQCRIKSGVWGKTRATQVFGNETPEEVVSRLNRLNPDFRIAE
ncbi:MAG: hypothetical protein LBC56_00410 [Oscillospiraceae bacterium]|nr:hypothetical protein [Oscillospiraceae bacterium]